VELLERDDALAALLRAREEAALGRGRVALVTGEPGIGKTSLVTQFVRDLEPGARVLLGSCDDLTIPRPLGPLRDLVGYVSSPLERALADGAATHELQRFLLEELELRPRPTVLVLEDVHWADDATLDAITVLGRRIASLPALVVLTFRGGEVPPAHPLRTAVGALRADDAVYVDLAPLSEVAVATLAGGADADAVYAATGGNPFYVTELIAARTAAELPPSVANAVLGRASRLDESSRRLVELVSIVPGRMATSLLDETMPEWPAAAEEPERRQLLDVEPRYIRFRHELAREAIRSSIPVATRRRLHAEILAALLAAHADPADIVHHAEAAGDEDVVADYALVAARQAAALESNREAYSHYRRAADFVGRLDPSEQAKLLEELAWAAYAFGRLGTAFPSLERAIAAYRELGDDEAVGRCTRCLSRFHWFAGDGVAARRTARDAIAILEPLGPSVELARAYSGLSQLAMLAESTGDALAWGERALELAVALRDESTRAHALTNLGTTRMLLDRSDIATLLDAHRVADAAGDGHEATRALANLSFNLLTFVQPAESRRRAEAALEYAEAHEVHTIASYLAAAIGWLRLRAGEWEDAEHIARCEVDRGIDVAQLLAKTVLAELAVRRGDLDATDRLNDLAAQAGRADELQRVVPVFELATEWALTSGPPVAAGPLAGVVAELRTEQPVVGWGARAAAWAAVDGVAVEVGGDVSEPHAAMLQRDWRGAADAFGAVGWDYDRALMLSLLDDEESLGEAIGIARGLGAEPLTRRVARRLRDLGLSVPHGPRESTRANPAGLTARQLEVLELLAGGLTNAEIADRLVVSPRTAEHHVAAVLTKLGATTRRDAARRAAELGLVSTQTL
jgi:DNA-binding CsgD family transcriptional regulator/tetratricopeptide (TPR) repeat protein